MYCVSQDSIASKMLAAGAHLMCLVVLICSISACTQHHALITPQHSNIEAEQRVEQSGHERLYEMCPSQQYDPTVDRGPDSAAALPGITSNDPVLSPGDLIEVYIENGDGFNGRYVVSPEGLIHIPYLRGIQVRGLDTYRVAERVELELVRAEMFQASTIAINVQVLEWAEIDVVVSGAVFQPGRHFINKHYAEARHEEKTTAFGDYRSTRLLSEALRAASGIRPDANVERVILERNGWHVEINMKGVLTGESVTDVPLIAGDKVTIPSLGCVRSALIRPSQITPKGFRVFMSNLTDSAHSNANAAVGRFSANLPYGARLLQAAVSANCVGGAEWTNAPRKVMVASNDPVTGEFKVVQRSIEALMRFAHDEVHNPYLMPNDAVACYDSDATNMRDIARFMLDIISPFRAL